MDSRRFDALTRAFAIEGTRRRILAALAALPLGGLVALDEDEATAERPRDRLKRRHQQRNRKRRNQRRRKRDNSNNNNGGKGGAKPGNCTPNGQACNRNNDCCNGNCFGQVCSNTVNQCGGATCNPAAPGCCPNDGCCGSPANQCNAAELCCTPNCANRECGPDGCGNSGTCGSCQKGQSCDVATGQCLGAACSPASCPNGCCDNDGDCHPGTTVQACGTGGVSCKSCQGTQSSCQNGQCRCTAQCQGKQCGDDGCGGSCGNCPTGQTCTASGQCQQTPLQCLETCNGATMCCDAENNCVSGTTNQSCGSFGSQCLDCRPGFICNSTGQCECTPSCQGKTCGDDGCGGSCGTCPINQFCHEQNNPTNWQCADKCTPDNCGNGCCDATGTCQQGNANAACGTFGTPCKTCDPNCQVCVERTSDKNGVGLDWICAHRCRCGLCGCPEHCNAPATCDETLQTCCTPAMEFVPCSDDGPCCPPAVCGVTRTGLGCCYPIGVVNPQRDVMTCCGQQSAMDQNGVCCHPGINGGCA